MAIVSAENGTGSSEPQYAAQGDVVKKQTPEGSVWKTVVKYCNIAQIMLGFLIFILQVIWLSLGDYRVLGILWTGPLVVASGGMHVLTSLRAQRLEKPRHVAAVFSPISVSICLLFGIITGVSKKTSAEVFIVSGSLVETCYLTLPITTISASYTWLWLYTVKIRLTDANDVKSKRRLPSPSGIDQVASTSVAPPPPESGTLNATLSPMGQPQNHHELSRQTSDGYEQPLPAPRRPRRFRKPKPLEIPTEADGTRRALPDVPSEISGEDTEEVFVLSEGYMTPSSEMIDPKLHESPSKNAETGFPPVLALASRLPVSSLAMPPTPSTCLASPPTDSPIASGMRSPVVMAMLSTQTVLAPVLPTSFMPSPAIVNASTSSANGPPLLMASAAPKTRAKQSKPYRQKPHDQGERRPTSDPVEYNEIQVLPEDNTNGINDDVYTEAKSVKQIKPATNIQAYSVTDVVRRIPHLEEVNNSEKVTEVRQEFGVRMIVTRHEAIDRYEEIKDELTDVTQLTQRTENTKQKLMVRDSSYLEPLCNRQGRDGDMEIIKVRQVNHENLSSENLKDRESILQNQEGASIAAVIKPYKITSMSKDLEKEPVSATLHSDFNKGPSVTGRHLVDKNETFSSAEGGSIHSYTHLNSEHENRISMHGYQGLFDQGLDINLA